jgi:hypothetical protein
MIYGYILKKASDALMTASALFSPDHKKSAPKMRGSKGRSDANEA